MIDLTRIRSIKTLEDMKKDLEFFIREPIIAEIYLEDYGWDEEDLGADRDEAQYCIEKIDKRIASLNKWNEKKISLPKAKQGKRRCKKSEPKEIACEGQSSEEHAHDPCTSNDNNPSEVSPQ